MRFKPGCALLPIIALVAVTWTACATSSEASRSDATRSAAAEGMANPEDAYAAFGISRSTIEPWEDGMRTTGAKGSYEWWYFDSNLSDGSTLVIAFYTKNQLGPDGPLDPSLTFDLTGPDGSTLHRESKAAVKDFSAAKDRCDVRVGPNSFSGDLHDYAIHVELEGVKADLRLHGTVAPWRPGSGYLTFGDKGEHYFAWLPSVPQGDVEGRITIGGRSRTVAGVGYHDHNWGDISILELIHDWYWGRAQIGSYSIIASYIIAADKYGKSPHPIFMLARDGKIIADDSMKVRFSAEDVYIDRHTKKPVANKIVYDFHDGSDHYRVTFSREKDLMNLRFVEALHGIQSLLARLAKIDGAYLRFTGSATVERYEGDQIAESATQSAAVWELMYFGHAPRVLVGRP